MDKLGYLLSEIPLLIFIVWFAVRFFQYRRRKNHQPSYSETDRDLLFGTSRPHPPKTEVYLRLALAIVAVTMVGVLEFLVLAPFGAAIVTTSLVLTSTAIVHHLL
ncbi:MAG TPA: hypothetical protein VF452_00175 [Candidatus Binatia bacterium]